MAWISNNRYLTLEEQQNNAILFRDYFIAKGWTINAICGMLGNIQTESTTNPGLWESMDEGNLQNGYGLVQWTPATKYIDWAGSNYADGNRQCDRIQYEVDNGLQWIATSQFPMSFEEFTKSTDTPYNLAMVFIKNYERPFDSDQPIRGEQANYWYSFLKDGVVNPPDPTDPPTKGDYLILKKNIYNFEDSLFGRKFTSKSNKAKLIKKIGNLAVIEVDGKKVNINYNNLKKLS